MGIEAEAIKRLLAEGETQTVEFKADIRQPSELARIIAAFANADGGVIIVGVKEPLEIVGSNVSRIEKIYHQALSQFTPAPTSAFETLEIDSKPLAIVKVEKSRDLVLGKEGAFERVGASIAPMNPARIRDALQGQQLSPANLTALSENLSNLTGLVEELRSELSFANSIQGQWKNYLLSGVVGAVLGFLLTWLTK